MEKDRMTFGGSEEKRMEELLGQAYLELGKAYYEGAFEDPLPQLLPLFDRITKIRKEMRRKNESVRKQFCPYCGKEIEVNSAFCGYCGRQVK